MTTSIDSNQQWKTLLKFLESNVGKKIVDLKAILYLIGVQELGKGALSFSKEQKQDLIHIAVCKILSYGDYYALEGLDQEGWPHWTLLKPLPSLDIFSQENLLKQYIITYFQKEIGVHL